MGGEGGWGGGKGGGGWGWHFLGKSFFFLKDNYNRVGGPPPPPPPLLSFPFKLWTLPTFHGYGIYGSSCSAH